MPGFLSPGKGMPLLLIPEYSGINKGQRVPDRSKTAHRKSLVECFQTATIGTLMNKSQDRAIGWGGTGQGNPLTDDV